MAIGDRIRDFRMAKEPKLTQEQLAESIGIKRSRLAQYEAGRTEPPLTILKMIALALDTTLPELEDEGVPVPRKTKAVQDAPMPNVPQETVDMPYAGLVPADSNWGDPLGTGEELPVDIKFKGENRFVCKVVGDSCYPYLKQGDIAIFEVDPGPSVGTIILAERLGDRACTVKLLEWDAEAGRSRLKPLNEAYEPPSSSPGWQATAKLIGLEFKHEGVKMTAIEPGGFRSRQLAWRGFDI